MSADDSRVQGSVEEYRSEIVGSGGGGSGERRNGRFLLCGNDRAD